MKKWLFSLTVLGLLMVGLASISHSQEVTLLSAVDGFGNFRRTLNCVTGFTCNITGVTSIVASANIAAGQFLPSATGISLLQPTGVTPDGNTSPGFRNVMVKTTVSSTAFTCAALTCDVNIFTLPVHAIVVHAMADLTTTFACASVCTSATLTETLGRSAGGTQYLLSFNANTATGQFGLTQATLGTDLAAISATVPNAGVAGSAPGWASTQTVSIRLTSATGNVGTGAATNLSQGTVVIIMDMLLYP